MDFEAEGVRPRESRRELGVRSQKKTVRPGKYTCKMLWTEEKNGES